MRNRILSLLVLVASSWVSWIAFEAIAPTLFPTFDSAFIAWAILIAILIHEIGHWLVFEMSGIRSYIYILVLLGGAGPYSNDVPKLNNMSWSRDAALSLAGVIGNVVMVIMSFALYHIGVLESREMLAIANLNGSLIFFNLLPLAILDGKRFAMALFNSVPEHKDGRYAAIMGFVIIIAVVVVNFTTPETFFVAPLLLQWKLRECAVRDDPSGSTSPRAMSPRQQMMWMTAYTLLFVTGMAFMGASHGVFLR